MEEVTGYRVRICYENEEDEPNNILKEWDFSSWTIDASNADGNLILDENNTNRFNYKPSTTSEELKFENGSVIPDVKDLFFTAGADSKLRLGFNTGLLYLNGAGIQIKIACKTGNYITIEGMSGNAVSTDRGFYASGGIVNDNGTSVNISDGILMQAGANGTWSYRAIDDTITIITINGGMNISKITISRDEIASNICNEYDVTKDITTKTVADLVEEREYTYQVKAIRNELETAYSNAQTIVTRNPSAIKDATAKERWKLFLSGKKLIITGSEPESVCLYNLSGDKVKTVFYSTVIDLSGYSEGFYLVQIKTKEGMKEIQKIILR